jgi:hypothetical protein
MNDELQHLKNLGKTSAQWLHAVGIHSASTCVAWERWTLIGPCAHAGFGHPRCCCMRSKAPLMDVHWNDIPAERKEALNKQLEAISSRHKN